MKFKILILFFSLSISSFCQKKETFIYAIKGIDTLKLDVHTPINSNSKNGLPVLLWMHGGGFSGGSRDHINHEEKLVKYVTTKGFIGVSISYRLLRKGKKTGFGCNCSKQEKIATFKEAVIDYLDAAKYIINHKDELNIDITKIVAGGSSAGAEGVLNAVFMRSYFVDDLQKYESVYFAGVFSLAGAMVNANYITTKNAVPSVFFHGTEDNLVPFATAPHHYCDEDKVGYLMLDGSETIVKKLDSLQMPFYFYKVIGGKHELSSIPFEHLDEVMDFFNKTVLKNNHIQTKITINKK
ncbi:alpha/beta hydrolase [Polaribacter tangerinus]|uniref:carboxylesterase family protein n=1 Tax=Polaribacter tangerinus TaxID=1920034 RepID=UPI000B4AD03F|nr:alpha/beta hydrolase [Polaribacter tangerinus]